MLTPDIVDAASPPSKGEHWIADSKVRGFGLRMWAAKGGGSKAYAIRVSDLRGRKIRKTYDPRSSRQFWRLWGQMDVKPKLGALLEEARDWARTEIAHARGRETRAERQARRQRLEEERIAGLSLGEFAQEVIQSLQREGRTQEYLDRLDKLFSHLVPDNVKRTKLIEVSPEGLAESLVDASIPAGNLRTARAFVGQLFERASEFNVPVGDFGEQFNKAFWEKWEARYDRSVPSIAALSKDDYARLFSRLEGETAKWQQALCIRLYFEFGASLSRLMSGQWRYVVEDHWYPYMPGERLLWFESREPIRSNASQLLERVRWHIKRDFGNSLFFFPTHFGRSVEHIRSIEVVWQQTLHDIGFKYYPVREYGLRHRQPNNPSYLSDFLKVYGPTFRSHGNAEGIARKLRRRRRSEFDSSNFDSPEQDA